MSYTNDQAVISWAEQQDKRKRSGAISSEGPRLFSYRTAVAYYDSSKGVTFISENTYSATTSAHLKLARRYNKAKLVIYPNRVDYNSPEKMLQSAAELLKKHLAEISQARKHTSWRISSYNQHTKELSEACNLYDVTLNINLPIIDTSSFMFQDDKMIAHYIKEILKHEL